ATICKLRRQKPSVGRPPRLFRLVILLACCTAPLSAEVFLEAISKASVSAQTFVGAAALVFSLIFTSGFCAAALMARTGEISNDLQAPAAPRAPPLNPLELTTASPLRAIGNTPRARAAFTAPGRPSPPLERQALYDTIGII